MDQLNGEIWEEEASYDDKPPALVSLEEMIEHNIGQLNCTQVVQTILTSIPAFFDSQQTFISIFTHAQPKWHCNKTTNPSTCTSTSDICSLSKAEWSCDSGKPHTSIMSEWGVECASWFIQGLPTTCSFLGSLVGLLFATLGDSSLGRKKLLLVSSLLMFLAAFAVAFSPNLWVYSALRFLSGLGRGSITVTALVLGAEKVGKQWRGVATLIGVLNFALGLIALACLAFITRGLSWRKLYLSTSIPGIILSIVSYFFLYESPRWLFLQGRDMEAMDVLRKIRSCVSPAPNMFVVKKISNDDDTSNPFVSLMLLVKKRWAMKRLLASMILSFGIGLLYYGMFLGVESLGFSIYLTSIFNSLLSMTSSLLVFLFWIERFNRKSSLLGFCIISGTTSIAFAVLNKYHGGLLIGLELVSLFSACMAYNVLLVYMQELFPTCVRNSASSLARQSMILGSVFDPMLIIIGKKNKVFSYGVFGLATIICGFLVICLPETKGKGLSDTMEEEELKHTTNEFAK